MAIIVASWAALFLHNLRLVPEDAGFDAAAHLEYIQYIQAHSRLPFADEGWEMHQPPLYYLVSASVLNLLGLVANSAPGLFALRLLALAIGLAQTGFIFGSLRLLFPREPAKQVVGLALAGFMPMQLCLTHYPTNETLAACLASAAIYLTLKVLRRPSSAGWLTYGATGLYLGLGLVSKITTAILCPFVGTALVYAALRSENRRSRWLLPLCAMTTLLTAGGWHYWRVWQHTGTPVFQNTAFFGWVDPGFRTSAFFSQFGFVLVQPFFSGFSSFADGMYATLWGDGLCSGMAGLAERPPWNFDLMAVGYWAALLPTALLIVGLAFAVARFLHRPRAPWVLLLGFSVAMLLALTRLNLREPFIAVVKSFYGLSALTALCAFAGLGWGWLDRRAGIFKMPLAALFAFWALTTYASFWVPARSSATELALGRAQMAQGDYAGAMPHLEAAAHQLPEAGSALFAALICRGREAEAGALAARNMAVYPGQASCHLDMAQWLERRGEPERALGHLERAIALAPDDPKPRLRLASLVWKLGQPAQTVSACREALRLVPVDPEVHLLLGRAFAACAASGANSPTNVAGGEWLAPNAFSAGSADEVLLAQARYHLRLAFQLNPDSTGPKKELARLAPSPIAGLGRKSRPGG